MCVHTQDIAAVPSRSPVPSSVSEGTTKDNPTMSQIFIGTVPLMGTANEILRAAPAVFQAGARVWGRGWRSFAAGRPTRAHTRTTALNLWDATAGLQLRRRRFLRFCHLLIKSRNAGYGSVDGNSIWNPVHQSLDFSCQVKLPSPPKKMSRFASFPVYSHH